MAKIHQLLAAEGTVTSQAKRLMDETAVKFGKPHMFEGQIKTLTMLEDSAANRAIQDSAKEVKNMQSTVAETLSYALSFWANAEDLQIQKNRSNQNARANLEFRGKVLVNDVPIDELLGLENRLTELRKVIAAAPTLDASKEWKPAADISPYVHRTANAEETVKTEKTMTAVVLYEATDKHPAQIEKISQDKVIGKFTLNRTSGAITARAKADALGVLDDLIGEVKKARTRANETEVVDVRIGKAITDLIMNEINKA